MGGNDGVSTLDVTFRIQLGPIMHRTLGGLARPAGSLSPRNGLCGKAEIRRELGAQISISLCRANLAPMF
eukprot:4992775-Pyramimonas_sp.AAC.1